MKRELHDLRVNYNQFQLVEADIPAHPFDLFQAWFDKALQDQIDEPNAMVLATQGLDGFPNARVVLLKEVNNQGFVFFTNYGSEKAKELEMNPNAALVFNWLAHHRQVRIRGVVEKISVQESEAYFKTRPYESQIGAWASHQSDEIKNRKVLELAFEELTKKYKEGEVPMPEFWGGYRLLPVSIEFWQGREGRLHDRIVYEKDGSNWNFKRVSP